MRLIDADALIKKIFPYDVVDKKCYTINAKVIHEEINKAPTVDIKTEVAREIFDEVIDKISFRYLNDVDYSFGDMIYDLNELKNKYTEGNK